MSQTNVTTTADDDSFVTIHELTERALESFWEVVAKQFPEAKCGDMSPTTSGCLQNAAEEAVAEWILINVDNTDL